MQHWHLHARGPEHGRELQAAWLVVSSNKTLSAWAEIFGDRVAIAAMVDRHVPRRGHRRKGDSH